MIIKQLSIFLENRSGRLLEVTELLGKNGLNLSALSLADTAEYGILRLIVSDPEKALDLLKQNGFSVRLTDVVCLCMPNKAGELAKALKTLSDKNISVEYMYAFSKGDQSFIVLRTENIEKDVEILSESNLGLLKACDVYNI